MNIPPELIEAFSLIKEIPQPIKEYRIHFNKNGFITGCSMINHPESEFYVVVDQDTYNNYFRYDKVINGKLRKIVYDAGYRVKLYPSTTGYRVVKNHAALLLEANESYDNTEFYSSSSD